MPIERKFTVSKIRQIKATDPIELNEHFWNFLAKSRNAPIEEVVIPKEQWKKLTPLFKKMIRNGQVTWLTPC